MIPLPVPKIGVGVTLHNRVPKPPSSLQDSHQHTAASNPAEAELKHTISPLAPSNQVQNFVAGATKFCTWCCRAVGVLGLATEPARRNLILFDRVPGVDMVAVWMRRHDN